METASTEVTSIRRRNNVEKSTWKTHRYFVDFESRIHVKISTSNRCHNFHVDSPFKIDVISTNFPHGISTSNRWQIDEDVPIGNGVYSRNNLPKKIKDGAYVINLDEYAYVGTHSIALFCNRSKIVYFDGFGVEHVPKEI